MAGAIEVVLDVQLPLPLLLRHHCIVVSIVVQQLVTGLKGPVIEAALFMANEKSDDLPYGSNNGMAAVIVTHYVGVAAVVDQGKRPIRSCTDFILMGENEICS